MRNILVAVQYNLSGEMCTCIVDENEWIFIHNLRGRLNALNCLRSCFVNLMLMIKCF
jgi:hypothetical protein